MDYPKFVVSNQKEESISVQRVKPLATISDLRSFRKNFQSTCLFVITAIDRRVIRDMFPEWYSTIRLIMNRTLYTLRIRETH